MNLCFSVNSPRTGLFWSSFPSCRPRLTSLCCVSNDVPEAVNFRQLSLEPVSTCSKAGPFPFANETRRAPPLTGLPFSSLLARSASPGEIKSTKQ